MQWGKELDQNIEAQGDTGANASATNRLEIIHDYKPFDVPEPVSVFYEGDKTQTLLTAMGTGYILIISDQGTVMRWKVVYTPKSSGTVLSPDHYHRSNKDKLFGFFHFACLLDIGTIGFTNEVGKIVESISLKRNNNGQWLTTDINRVLLPERKENYHILQVTTRAAQRQALGLSQEKLSDKNTVSNSSSKEKSSVDKSDSSKGNKPVKQQRYPIGTRVKKKILGQFFYGTVASYDPTRQYFFD